MFRKVLKNKMTPRFLKVFSKSLLTALYYRQIIAKKKKGTGKYRNVEGPFTESHFLIRTSSNELSLAPGNIDIAELHNA